MHATTIAFTIHNTDYLNHAVFLDISKWPIRLRQHYQSVIKPTRHYVSAVNTEKIHALSSTEGVTIVFPFLVAELRCLLNVKLYTTNIKN